MKTTKILCCLLLLFLILSASSNCAGQGSSCDNAIHVSVSSNQNESQFNFVAGDELWLVYAPDVSVAEFYFSPGNLSSLLNIESVDVFAGNDCAQLYMEWSHHFLNPDSSGFSTSFHFSLQDNDGHYYIKIKKQQSASSGFVMRISDGGMLGGCVSSCPNLIKNGDFSTFNSVCVTNSNVNMCPDPFNHSCICGWAASHGTPNYNSTLNNAVMGCTSGSGEGIYQKMPTQVVQGRNYLLTYDYQNSGSAYGYSYQLHTKLMNGNINAGINCFESLPGVGWDIPNTPVVQSMNWRTVHRCFTANADYSTLLIYPETNSANTSWVTIDNVSLEELDAPMTNKDIYCNGPVLLCPPCPSVNPAVHYLWSTGETTSCISVAPLVTTSYTLTVSVIENNFTICSYVLPVTVFVHNPGPVSMITSNVTCSTPSVQTYCFSSAQSNAYTYTVNPPNAISVNGNCVTVNWTNIPSSCATIDVVASNNYCSTNASFQVCLPCQGNPNILTFCDQTASAVLNNPLYATYITGGNIFKVPPGSWASIHGTFTVDVPFVFDHSDVRLNKDAKIVVGNASAFEVVNQSWLHSCDGINMWDGIYTDDVSAHVYIHDSNNLIEDAKNAVVSSNGGKFTINSTTFNNNYIGIKINQFNGVHAGKVYGCTFTGTGLLLSPYSNYCMLSYPYCGIVMDHVNQIQIGEPLQYSSYGRNIFLNLFCGINANCTNMHVYTSEFHNMLRPPSFCNASDGIGIYALGHPAVGYRINVGNTSTSEKCLFDHCVIGISENKRCYGNILSNSFTHCETGVMNLMCSKNKNLVKGNSFEDFKRGIYFYNALNNLQYGLEIYENQFNAGMNSFNPATYGKEAIYVTNAISGSTNLWVVGNLINYSQTGVFARNIWEPCQIRSNTINFDILPQQAQALGPHHGIQCENDNGLEIDNNYIRWRNQPSAPVGFVNFMNGISINYSSNTTAISGGIFDNRIGPYPAVNTGNTYGLGTGINISSDCIGLALYCNKIARCEEGITFRAARLGPQGYLDQQQQWFSNGNTFSYTPASGAPFRIGGSVIQTVDWAYASPVENPSPFQGGSIISHAAGSSFYNCQPPAPADDVKRDGEYGNLIDEPSPLSNPDFSGYEEKLRYAAEEKFFASVQRDSSLIEIGTPDDFAYSELYADLASSNISAIQDIKLDLDSMDFSSALQKLIFLEDSNLMEQNKKLCMHVYLETIANGMELDSANAALLEPVSNLHPIIGGEAIFWACAMLDKSVNNNLPPLRKGNIVQAEWKENVPVYFPNPAKDILYIKYEIDRPFMLNIADVSGRGVLQRELNQNYAQIEIGNLNEGIYTVNFTDGNKLLYSGKLNISR